jgi:hypothetical protein
MLRIEDAIRIETVTRTGTRSNGKSYANHCTLCMFNCRECGAEIRVQQGHLATHAGMCRTCARRFVGRNYGRFNQPSAAAAWVTHGMTTSLEYKSFRSARDRCMNRANKDWKRYGGRGIKFLFESFEQFYAELGPRPEGMSLDRIDNSGNYEIGNCRWATRQQQARNRRNSTQQALPLAA